MTRRANRRNEQQVHPEDSSLFIFKNIALDKIYLSDVGQKSILITSIKKGYQTENKIKLELEHPDHFGLLQLNYKGPRFLNYFPPNTTVIVSEVLLTKTNVKNNKFYWEYKQKNVTHGIWDIKHIITEKESDCDYLFKKAIKDKYTIVLAILLNIIDANNSSRPFALYFHDDNCPLLHRAVEKKDMEFINTLLDYNLNINTKNEAGWTPLHVAIDLEMPDIVDFLISNGADVNAQNDQLQLPLHYAVRKNNFRILNSLLKSNYKLNVNAKNKMGLAPLLVAVDLDMLDVVNFLISNGANVNIQNKMFQSPLHLAAKKNNIKILDSLLKNQAKIDKKDKNGRTPLHYAVTIGNVNNVDILLKKGADYKLLDRSDRTAFHVAAQHKNLNMIEVFLKNNVDADILNSRRQTPLYYVSERSFRVTTDYKKTCLKIINTLIKKGANINFQDIEGNTSLHHAVMKNNNEFLQILLECKADISIQNNSGKNVLHLACLYQANKCMRVLLDHNIDIYTVDNEGRTALHIAAESNNYKSVELILRRNRDINIKDSKGRTALHLAIQAKCTQPIVELLLKNGANVNLIDISQETALHSAIRSADLSIVELLLENKADVNLKDSYKRNALLLAIQCQCFSVTEVYENSLRNKTSLVASLIPKVPIQVLKLILNSIDDINATDNFERTAVHYAISYKNINTLKCLLEKNANVNIKDSKGRTPLHLLMIRGNYNKLCIEFIRVLLDNKADINAVDNNLTSPLHLACLNKNIEIVKYLIKNGADFRMRDKDGRTVFHYVCMVKSFSCSSRIDYNMKTQSEDILNLLVERDISINCVDKFGKTPLHYAVEDHDCSYVYEYLLNIGADINIVDKNDKSPFDNFKNSEYRYYDNEIYSRAETYIEHVIKMKVLKLPIHERILKKVYKVYNKNYSVFIQIREHACNKEIDSMKNTNIDQSNITYYDFLKKSSHDTVNFTHNPKIVNAIKSDDLIDIFPIYGYFLKCHLREVQRRSHLYDQIQEWLKPYIFEKLPIDCMNEIFKYLNISELEILFQAIKFDVSIH